MVDHHPQPVAKLTQVQPPPAPAGVHNPPLKVRKFPTRTVYLKASGRAVSVRADVELDAALYSEDPIDGKSPEPPKAPPAPPAVSSFTREEMARMSLTALKALPEWERTDQKATNKDEVIEAILGARAGG